MRFLFLVAALTGCHSPGSDGHTDGTDGINPGDDTGATNNPSTVGYIDGYVFVNDAEEACQANIFDASGDLVAIDYTGDNELAELPAGEYTVAFGLTAYDAYADQDFADEVDDLTDSLYLHQDPNGDFWTDVAKAADVLVGKTATVETEMSRVFAMCPADDPDCNEPGLWTCEDDGETYQDIMEIERNEDGLSIYVPCIGDLNLAGNRIFYGEDYDGGFTNASYIEISDLHDSSKNVRLWVGDDGDEP